MNNYLSRHTTVQAVTLAPTRAVIVLNSKRQMAHSPNANKKS
jgi:hypothetical protein